MATYALPRTLVALLLAGAVAVTAAVPATAAPPTASRHPTHSATQDTLQAITRAGTPGAMARVDRAHESWHGTSGVADLRTGRPRLPQDRFRAGSLMKPFIATVLLQLAAEPEYGLAIDDTVDKWLPGLVRGNGNDGRRITLRQLLQQTSGLHDYIKDSGLRAKFTGEAFFAHRYEGATPEELVRVALAHRPRFDPGEQWEYSNTNYILAGMVIEKATGNSYALEVERRIIKPLGLRGTTLPGTSSSVPGPHGRNHSKLFVDGPAARIYDVTDFNPSVSGASGEIISTARDLNVFMRALLRGELLPPAQQKEMFTVRDLGGGRSYGLGIRSQTLETCGVEVWGHSGDTFGSATRTAATADGEHVITLNQNSDWGDHTLKQAVIEAEFCGPRHR
ncbi:MULTISPECIES: serine hydrolase domain-containing protein [Streptomyces]|uniref:serine hydrolase domain-containing protein n=1 Tax=Streptomyces TaxID=1883 RepID=UPI0022A9A8FD|nr:MULTISPECIES: serine hydrolase domain-containing protein [Streptomyces]UFQ19857.1 beta-lactamase family protein [Streptomyces huasconensis]WCL89480.1 serine hydrolase [Streptomyces sp. JCM 35825]